MQLHQFYSIHINDELPRIGQGHRLVFIEKVGRRWITVRSPITLASNRIDGRILKELTNGSCKERVRLATIDKAMHNLKIQYKLDPKTFRRIYRKVSKAERAGAAAMRAAIRR